MAVAHGKIEHRLSVPCLRSPRVAAHCCCLINLHRKLIRRIASQQSIVRQPEVEVSVRITRRSTLREYVDRLRQLVGLQLLNSAQKSAEGAGCAAWLLLLLLLPSLRRRAARGRSSSGRALAVPNRRADVDEAREIMRAVIMLLRRENRACRLTSARPREQSVGLGCLCVCVRSRPPKQPTMGNKSFSPGQPTRSGSSVCCSSPGGAGARRNDAKLPSPWG